MVGAQGWSGLSAVVGHGACTSLRNLKLGEINLGINVAPEEAAHLTLRCIKQDNMLIHSKAKFGMPLNDEFKEIKIKAEIPFLNSGYWENVV